MSGKEECPTLNEYFKALKEKAPQRDAEEAAKGRVVFLAEVDKLRRPTPKSWFENLQETLSSLQIKGNRRFATVMASILIAVILTFSAVGGTVYASQTSLPYQSLYPVKILSENVRLTFTGNPEDKIELLARFTERRVEELSALSEENMDISTETLSRLDQHTEAMLQLSAKLEEGTQSQSLTQVRNAFQVQERIIHMLAQKETGKAEQALLQVQERLQAKIQLAEQALDDPAILRKNMEGQTPAKPTKGKKPGKPEDVGTPEDKGKPEDIGTPPGKGKPDNVGTPEDKGEPEVPGPPDDKGKPEDPGPPDDIGKP